MRKKEWRFSRTRGKEISVAVDKYDVLGPIYAAIGEEAANIVGTDPDGLYLYGEAGEGRSGGGLFMDEGPVVRYYRPTRELCALLLQAWEAEEPKQKWELMEYHIKGTSFDAKLIYPDQIDHDLPPSEIRGGFLRNRFGDKPVIYPPLPTYVQEALAKKS
jgi:hypothetical protein